MSILLTIIKHIGKLVMYEHLHRGQNNMVENQKCSLLWSKVIKQALEDACTEKPIGENKSRYNITHNQAKNWLIDDNKEFNIVCNMANLNPNKTKKNIINYLNIKKGILND